MKRKESEEFKKFDKTMGDLLSVSYGDLKKKLDEEKAQKSARKRGLAFPATAFIEH